MENWVLQPIINPIVIALIVAIVLLMVLIGPSFSKLSSPRRMSLSLLRTGVILLALLAMLRPGCVQTIEKNQSAVILFLIDVTRSMELPHHDDNVSRWEALRDSIDENKSKISKLQDEKIEIRFFAFDNSIRPMEIVDGEVVLPEHPLGSETDIGTAVYQTSQDVRDERLIGVIVASDGVQNAMNPNVELTRAAETLDDLEVPLWALKFGLPGESSTMADIAIKNLAEQHRIVAKNKLTVKSTLVARGFTNQAITVQLIVIDAAGNEEIVNSIQVTPRKQNEEIPIALNYVPPEPGEFRLKVRALPQAGELAKRNNELPSFLTVREGGLRVLFLEGDLTAESNQIKRTIPKAAPGVDLEYIVIYPHTQNQWPIGQPLTDYLNDPTFDVFIIGDLHSSALFDPNTQTENLEALANAVSNGKGLLMLGGLHSFGAGRYQQTPLARIMPIIMQRDENQELGNNVKIREDLHINRSFKLRPTTTNHFLTNLGGTENVAQIWEELPALTGANRFLNIQEGAEVLLETNDNIQAPIMVASQPGGRVVAFAGDQTWRWNSHGYKEEFETFWSQIILWLAFWDGKDDSSVWINLSQRRFQPRSVVDFTVGAGNVTGRKIDDATFEATLVSPDASAKSISLSQAAKNTEGRIDPDAVTAPGLYRIEVVGKVNGQEIGKASREFIVFDRDKEKATPAADPEQMSRLASQTQEHGGKAIEPQDLGALLDDISKNPPDMKIEVPMKWRLGENYPDSIAFLLMFVGLLATEWLLRKKWGLV